MKLFKIEVENYRLLKNFSVDIEDELSLVIGKNNTGKTSLLFVMEKFLNPSERNKFYFDDFNIDFKNEIRGLVEGDLISEDIYTQKGLNLKLYIQYTETCNLENISKVMMDLDPENNYVLLGFEYSMPYNNLIKLRNDFRDFSIHEQGKKGENPNYRVKNLYDFLNKTHMEYFRMARKSIEIDKTTLRANNQNYIDLDKESISIKDIINFKYVSARREVANKEVDKTLSTQTSRIYEKTEASEEQDRAVEEFKDKLSETDDQLTEIYEGLFSSIIKKVGDLGGLKPNESEIEIISNLQHRELLKENTTVVYKHGEDDKLPEHYNGLGYMNLICMIFEIEILIQEFKRDKEKKPADINLLFIEEPEAHTHPQMQYVFIKNIKKLLNGGIKREDGQNRSLQYIISTHSSHIVADSDFDDIKYLKKVGRNNVVAKNLKDLRREYEEHSVQYKFLTQYLTISRAEIFFAEKAVLIEGDTERMLIPAIMKKLDMEMGEAHDGEASTPLLSQNISIIEVGAYSQIFDQFIDFLGIKALIITDIDSTKETENAKGKTVHEACPVHEADSYSNNALSHFFMNPSLADLLGFGFQNKLFTKQDGLWTNNHDGKLCVVYQSDENGYNARSFEDAFIHLNRDFVNTYKADFKGLKNREYFDDPSVNSFLLAKDCISKKTHFALDIIFHSDELMSNWQIPSYIKEGLLWLKKD